LIQVDQVLGSAAFLCLVVWTTTFMALVTFVRFLAFTWTLSFGVALLVLIEFGLLYLAKFFWWLVNP
jgi:hypothetical protein